MFLRFLVVLGVSAGLTLAQSNRYDPLDPATDTLFKCNRDSFSDQVSNDEFDWEFFNKFNHQKTNTLVSPLSLKMAMGMLYMGAEGRTKDQLTQVMGYKTNETILARKFKLIRDCLRNPVSQEYILELGSRMYAEKMLTVKQKFRSILLNSFGADVRTMDKNYPHATVKEANLWVREVTKGKIRDLLQEDDLKSVVVLLLSAIYLKASWATPFQINDTSDKKFYLGAKQSVDVPFMTQTEKFEYFDSKEFEAKILRMPFKGDALSMTILLPNSISGLQEMIGMITSSNINHELQFLKSMNVKVSIPKFRFDYESKLVPVMRELGITDIFENSASLPGIASGVGLENKLAVNNILQKAGIDVNELGVEAYAASAVTLVNKFGVDEDTPEEFNANKPFLFFIEDSNTKQVLFSGTVLDPTQTSGKYEAKVPEVITVANEITTSTAAPQEFSLDPEGRYPSSPSNSKSRFHYLDQELLEAAADQNSGNFMISPASIKSTLAMIYEGANGLCARELKNTLRLPDDISAARNLFSSYLNSLNYKSNGVLMESANAVFLNKDLQVNRDYDDVLNQYYLSRVTSVNFRNPRDAAFMMNQWVSQSTHNIIRQFVTEDDFNPNAVLLLANAIYFKGAWETAFDTKMTFESCFKTGRAGCHNVHMMHSESEYNFGVIDDINSKVIEIPYKGNKFSMIIILPAVEGELSSVLKDLRHVKMEDIVKQMSLVDVQLSLPKFKIDFDTDLTPVLQKVGIKEMFTPSANLSGIIVGRDGPQVNRVIHKTHIEVDEQGSVAAAVTGVMVVPLMGSDTEIMRVDHPFLFFIRDMETGAILFGGRVDEPNVVPITKTTPRSNNKVNKPYRPSVSSSAGKAAIPRPRAPERQPPVGSQSNNPVAGTSTGYSSVYQEQYQNAGTPQPSAAKVSQDRGGISSSANFGQVQNIGVDGGRRNYPTQPVRDLYRQTAEPAQARQKGTPVFRQTNSQYSQPEAAPKAGNLVNVDTYNQDVQDARRNPQNEKSSDSLIYIYPSEQSQNAPTFSYQTQPSISQFQSNLPENREYTEQAYPISNVNNKYKSTIGR